MKLATSKRAAVTYRKFAKSVRRRKRIRRIYTDSVLVRLYGL
jgi:hypothetical protein